MTTFEDNFSRQADRYARFRPGYPPELFAYLAGLATHHELAWDCATGNGQAACSLAPYFQRVVASDASQRQIEHAEPHPRVEYVVAPAERSTLPDGSVDLITVAQALHWFDHDAFFAECERVAGPNCILAAWGYTTSQISPAVDPLLDTFTHHTLRGCWSPKIALVERGYGDIATRFAEIEPPRFFLEVDWTIQDLAGYLGTWSATERFIELNGDDPVARLLPELARAWGNAERRRVRWPISLRVFRIP